MTNRGECRRQRMTPGRKSTVAPGMNMVLAKASADEMRGFASYFGTLDMVGNEVVHHVQAALAPSWVGTDLRRSYMVPALGEAKTELIWERDS